MVKVSFPAGEAGVRRADTAYSLESVSSCERDHCVSSKGDPEGGGGRHRRRGARGLGQQVGKNAGTHPAHGKAKLDGSLLSEVSKGGARRGHRRGLLSCGPMVRTI